MNLGYQFYRDSLIKVAILSVACVGIFWDWFHGQSKDEPGVVLLIAVLIVVSNVGLFLAMRHAKRLEDAQKSQASAGVSGRSAPIIQTEDTQAFEKALCSRKKMRNFMACWAIGGGTLFSIFGCSYSVDGVPVPWVGYVLMLVGTLGLFGVNVFYGGPLDLRLDRRDDRSKTRADTKQSESHKSDT